MSERKREAGGQNKKDGERGKRAVGIERGRERRQGGEKGERKERGEKGRER